MFLFVLFVGGGRTTDRLTRLANFGRMTNQRFFGAFEQVFGEVLCTFAHFAAFLLGLIQDLVGFLLCLFHDLRFHYQRAGALFGGSAWVATAAYFSGIAAVIVWSFYRLTSADAALMAKYNNGEITKEECDRALSHKY